MADLTEISNFEAGIYQLETTDPVQGGLNGISNLASTQLANRTLFLKNQADTHALAADPHPQYLTPDEALLLSDSPAYRDVLVISAPTTLTPADLNRLIVFNGTVATDVNLPSIALCPIGSVFAFKNMSATSSIDLVANGTDVFDGVSLADVITIQPSQTLLIAAGEIVVEGVLATWLIVGGTAKLGAATISSRVGSIFYHIGNTPPAGALAANGATYNELIYPELHTVLQNPALNGLYGNVSNGYWLPDLRGEFLRGWDNGRGVDTGRAIGSWQRGSLMAAGDDLQNNIMVVTNLNQPTNKIRAGWDEMQDYSIYNGAIEYGGVHTLSTILPLNEYINHTGVSRPRNQAYLACIWYQ